MTRDITRLLHQASAGDRQANDALFSAVYQELRTLARSQRRRWSGNPTLNTTALINEAYLKLAHHTVANYSDRSHFFATASRAMRQILVNYAERAAAAKRGSNPVRLTLSGLPLASDDNLEDLLQIDALLSDLEANNPRHCRVFECRVFGGMTVAETAGAIGVSKATVKRDWAVVSAWVYSRLDGSGRGSGK
jgi:RNA polymerase sigma factor (TIGR02999 family)